MADMTMLERIRIQMEYAVPLIKDLQDILGEDVINEALEKRITLTTERARQGEAPEADFSRMAESAKMFAAGNALDFDVIASDSEHFDMNVTGCRYAEMMEDLGGRDIGHLLVCGVDFAAAERAGMHLERTQTRMQGAEYCNFRYSRTIRAQGDPE